MTLRGWGAKSTGGRIWLAEIVFFIIAVLMIRRAMTEDAGKRQNSPGLETFCQA